MPAEPITRAGAVMRSESEALLEVALRAHQAGLCVLPPREDGTKAPDAVEWASRRRSRSTEDEIREWYANGRTGLGIVCGAVSGGLELFEFDCRETWEEFQRLAEDAGLSGLLARIADGYLENTPSGGVHLFYFCDTPSTTKLARRLKRAAEMQEPSDRIKTLIECKGEGGYAITAPSYGGVHPSGGPYHLVRGGFETIVRLTADERAALHDLARSFDEVRRDAATTSQRLDTCPSGRVRAGDDYNRGTTWEDVLELHGWKKVSERRDVTYWRRPGKPVGVSATTNYAGSDLLWVFSSSTPFETERSYDRFGAYAVLEHGGDLSSAARALAELGYGSAPTDGKAHHSEAEPTYGAYGAYRAPQEDLWPQPLEAAALHGLAGEFVRLVEPHTEADPAALLVQFLVGFGALIGRNRYFVVEADRHYSNLFVVLVGRSSRGRKGTAASRVLEQLDSVEQGWERNRVSGLSSGEGLIWAVRDPILKREREKAHKGSVYVDVEVDPGVADKRLLVIESEFASTLRVIAREGSTLSALMRDAWDRGDLRSLTKNSPARATGAHISIIGHITRDELRAELTRTDAANGFANRFLFVAVKRSKLLPVGGKLSDVDFRAFRDKLSSAVEFSRLSGELRMDAEARELWIAEYPKLTADVPGLLGAVTSRAEAQVVRLALIYALLDWAGVIGRVHLEAALALWRYCADSARYIFGETLGDPVADEILRDLRAAGTLGRTRDEIRNLFKRHRPSEDLSRALGVLQQHGLAHKHTEPTAGRPTERWFVGSQCAKCAESAESPDRSAAIGAPKPTAPGSEA